MSNATEETKGAPKKATKKQVAKKNDPERIRGAFWVPPEQLVIVGIDDLEEGAEAESHILHDERVNLPLQENFIKNVMVLGVLKSVVARKGADGRYEVVDGRQRVRAAREANKRLSEAGLPTIRVPCLFRSGESTGMLRVMVSGNSFAQEDTILTKARNANRLLDMGLTEDEVGETFGKSGKTIQNWVSLLDLEPDLVDCIEAGKISPHEAMSVRDKGKKAQIDLAIKANRNDSPPKRGRRKRKEGEIVPPNKKTIRKLLERVEPLSDRSAELAAIALTLSWVVGIYPREAYLKDLDVIFKEAGEEHEDQD